MGATRAAHFLLHEQLLDSPPNAAMVQCYREMGLEVDVFAPAWSSSAPVQAGTAAQGVATYRATWLARNAARRGWRRYAVFSATSDAPIPVAAALALRARRPLVVLADEIYTGTYRGSSSDRWKRWVRAAIRRCPLAIVNDESRVDLLREAYGRPADKATIVYPAVYPATPDPADRSVVRNAWGCHPADFTALASGGLSELAGLPWLLQATAELPWLRAVLQATTLHPMAKSLLPLLRSAERVHLQDDRIPWRTCWSQAVGADVALAIYHNPAPQFQAMGISSNRLCMALSMGVPVIASRQPSFDFLDRYEAGIQVGSYEEFCGALERVRSDPERFRAGARACAADHLDPARRYAELSQAIHRAVGRTSGLASSA